MYENLPVLSAVNFTSICSPSSMTSFILNAPILKSRFWPMLFTVNVISSPFATWISSGVKLPSFATIINRFSTVGSTAFTSSTTGSGAGGGTTLPVIGDCVASFPHPITSNAANTTIIPIIHFISIHPPNYENYELFYKHLECKKDKKELQLLQHPC